MPLPPTKNMKPEKDKNKEWATWKWSLKALFLKLVVPFISAFSFSKADIPLKKAFLTPKAFYKGFSSKKKRSGDGKVAPKKITITQKPGSGNKDSFLIKPIKDARISSHYGYRMHPVLKKRKLHKGMDLAAPKGKPIVAAADGVVTRARYSGGYGNCIKIKHKNGFETTYAHLSRYAPQLKAGAKVKKGQSIGFVGSTGRSTGPHLHFELTKNGQHLNPKTYLLTT